MRFGRPLQMSRAHLRKRITALANVMKPPPNSLEAKIERLSPDKRTAYSQHQDRLSVWIKRNANRNFYEAILAGEAPVMPKALSEKLTGTTRVITADMTVTDAADVYRRFSLGE